MANPAETLGQSPRPLIEPKQPAKPETVPISPWVLPERLPKPDKTPRPVVPAQPEPNPSKVPERWG